MTERVQCRAISFAMMKVESCPVDCNVGEEVGRRDGTHISSPHADGTSDNNPPSGGGHCRGVFWLQSYLREFYDDNKAQVWLCIKVILAATYFVFFGFAMAHSFGDEGSMRLLVVTVLMTSVFITSKTRRICRDCCMLSYRNIKKAFRISPSATKICVRFNTWFYRLLTIGYAIFVIVWVIVDVGLVNPENLISVAGIAVFVFTFYITSYNPAAVKWRPVIWGLNIQFALALLILRWEIGFKALNWLGDRVLEFFAHTDAGAIFVFGEAYTEHLFAFKVLPIIVFLSTVVSILYHWGVMQFITRLIARTFAFCLGTSPGESLNAAGNIFIGMIEGLLVIQPFISTMTKSELHSVLTAGFASISAASIAAYSNFGIPANHLVAASVMSAPASLAISKLSYPETEDIKAKSHDVYQMAETKHANALAAASEGASASISVVANVAANLISIIALLSFVNSALTWCGHRVGWYDPELTFELICSYVLWPVAYLMGVHANDCRKVAELIGVKSFLNEFVAYYRLSGFIHNRDVLIDYNRDVVSMGWENATCVHTGENIYLNATNTTLIGGIVSRRSEVIATHALCGYSNFPTMGMVIGAFGTVGPERRADVTKMVLRAMIAGHVTCFITACVAGLLYQPIEDPLSSGTLCLSFPS